MNNFYPATSNIGGGSPPVGDLSTIDGTDLLDKDGALVISTGKAYLYTLDATSGEAESPPDIIQPLTNAGTKRWKLIQIYSLYDGAMAQLIYSNFPGGF